MRTINVYSTDNENRMHNEVTYERNRGSQPSFFYRYSGTMRTVAWSIRRTLHPRRKLFRHFIPTCRFQGLLPLPSNDKLFPNISTMKMLIQFNLIINSYVGRNFRQDTRGCEETFSNQILNRIVRYPMGIIEDGYHCSSI